MFKWFVCLFLGHKWPWREEGEMLRRWLTTGPGSGHECRRCGLDWGFYQRNR